MLVPDATFTTTVSVVATVELVTVNVVHAGVPAAVARVICPVILLRITVLVRPIN